MAARVLACATLLSAAGSGLAAEDIDAGALCAPFDISGLFAAPCRVDLEETAVVLGLDRPRAVATALCPTWADMMGTGEELGGGWMLRLTDPDGAEILAECAI